MGLGRLRQEKDEHEMHGSGVESYIYVVNHRFLSDFFVSPNTNTIFQFFSYQYPLMFGLILAFCWCSLVCCSRIYMGMHSILVRNNHTEFSF